MCINDHIVRPVFKCQGQKSWVSNVVPLQWNKLLLELQQLFVPSHELVKLTSCHLSSTRLSLSQNPSFAFRDPTMFPPLIFTSVAVSIPGITHLMAWLLLVFCFWISTFLTTSPLCELHICGKSFYFSSLLFLFPRTVSKNWSHRYQTFSRLLSLTCIEQIKTVNEVCKEASVYQRCIITNTIIYYASHASFRLACCWHYYSSLQTVT